MKKLLIICSGLALFLSFSLTGYSQELKPVLTNAVSNFFKTHNPEDQLQLSNRLDLIARKFNKEWAPAYYDALSKIMISYSEKDNAKKDAYLDQAEELLQQAGSLADKKNDQLQSELYAINAMLDNARIGVDPAKRWKSFGKKFDDNLKQAQELNPKNPRIYFLKGTSVFYTPKAFGGGGKRAMEYFDKARGLFAQEKKGDIFVPFWGMESNEYFIHQCQIQNSEKTNETDSTSNSK